MFKSIMQWLVTIFLSVWIALAIVPGSYWMDAGTLVIPDFVQGSDFEVRSTSKPKRPFSGSYSVIIRDAATNTTVAEDPSGVISYRPEAKRPNPIYISWWSPRLQELKPGQYTMETCWRVYQPFSGLVPSKTICVSSPVFEVVDLESELGSRGQGKW